MELVQVLQIFNKHRRQSKMVSTEEKIHPLSFTNKDLLISFLFQDCLEMYSDSSKHV